MLTTNDLKAERAKLLKNKSILSQQRDAIDANLKGTIGAISLLEKQIKQSEEADKVPAPEATTATDTPLASDPQSDQ